jgi:hypothetical protein
MRRDRGREAGRLSADSILDFEIAGDVGALPWIGRKVGRSAAADFFRDARRRVEPLRFEIHDILTKDDRAVILGELASRAKSTGWTRAASTTTHRATAIFILGGAPKAQVVCKLSQERPFVPAIC